MILSISQPSIVHVPSSHDSTISALSNKIQALTGRISTLESQHHAQMNIPGVLNAAYRAAFIALNAIACITQYKIYLAGLGAGCIYELMRHRFSTASLTRFSCSDGCSGSLPFQLARIKIHPVAEVILLTLHSMEHMAHHSSILVLKKFSHLGISQFTTGVCAGIAVTSIIKNHLANK